MIRQKIDSLRARWWRLSERRNIPQYRDALAAIVQQHPDLPVIAFPPGLGWQTQLFQRPQQLARALARRGALVFYQEPEHLPIPSGFQQEDARLYRCHVPVETFRGLEGLWVYALTWNWMFVERFGPARVIYDVVDHLSAFHGDPQTLRLAHERLARAAQIVLATSSDLHRWVSVLRPDAQLCPNGVDYEHFVGARQPSDAPPPADLAPILAAGRPIVGYYGALAAWVDYDLIAQVAALRPDLSLVLIGPDHDHSLPASLLALPNVAWLGVKPYANLPNHLRYFDVATIPFRLNEVTHAASPVKLFEYLAAGKPVVVTPMRESLRIPIVLPAADAGEFSSQITRALALRGDWEYLHQSDEIARQNTWEARTDVILGRLSRTTD